MLVYFRFYLVQLTKLSCQADRTSLRLNMLYLPMFNSYSPLSSIVILSDICKVILRQNHLDICLYTHNIITAMIIDFLTLNNCFSTVSLTKSMPARFVRYARHFFGTVSGCCVAAKAFSSIALHCNNASISEITQDRSFSTSAFHEATSLIRCPIFSRTCFCILLASYARFFANLLLESRRFLPFSTSLNAFI